MTPDTEQPQVRSSQCLSIASRCESNHSDDTACNVDDQEKQGTTTHDEKTQSYAADEDQSPPDGGYGWLVVLGSFLSLFTVFGTIFSWGVMQDYYEQNMFGASSTVQLSFVSTLILVFTFGGSLFSRIFELVLGTRFALLLATVLYTAGMEAAGSASEIWHLYLALGVCTGMGNAIIYAIAMRVTPQWFRKRRSTAMAMIASSTGVGGLVIPFIMTGVNQKLGASWTFRIMGLIFLVFNLSACLLVRERIQIKSKLTGMGDFFRPALYKDGTFSLWAAAALFQILYLFIPLFFVPSYATHVGLNASQGTALLAVLSSANFVGRIIAGVLADRFGCLNTNILYALMSCLSTFLIWTFAYDYGSMMAYAVVFGLFGGSFFALCSPITVLVVGVEKYPYAFSLLMVSITPGLFGSPIASAIERVSSIEPFLTYKIFTGIMAFFCTLLLVILRFRISRKFLAKV
ncbi:MFS general substrate transporter [Lichtheimia hyalospora FSU 10163]|nr:MFS general substrate transporter [Lichtheimia hyalospora FSU 10163]